MTHPLDRAESAMQEQVARGYWVVDRSAKIDLAPDDTGHARQQALAKLATTFDVPAELLHAPRGLNHWATWGAHLADTGPRTVPLAPPGEPGVCRHGDPHCPCPDGDPCHYVTHGDSAAMPCPRTGTVDCRSCP